MLLSEDQAIDSLEVLLDGIENSNRKVIVLKAAKAYNIFRKLLTYYGTLALMQLFEESASFNNFQDLLPSRNKLAEWQNIGGQLIPAADVASLLLKINKGKLNSWDEVHDWYAGEGDAYLAKKQFHAIACLEKVSGINVKIANRVSFSELLQNALETKNWMLDNILKSREKDYHNPFRKMVYDSQAEMDKVMGSLADNSFIKQEQLAVIDFEAKVGSLLNKLNPSKKAKRSLT